MQKISPYNPGHTMDDSVLDGSPIDTSAMEAAAIEAASLTDPPPALELVSADMAGLETGQQVMIQLPGEERGGGQEVIMEVVRVDGNQIHFIAPASSAEPGGAPAPGEEELKSADAGILQLPGGAEFAAAAADGAAFGDTAEECAAFDAGEGCAGLDTTTESAGFVDAAEGCAGFADTPGEEEPDLVVSPPPCFLCLRSAPGSPLHCLILGRTGATACSLAERLSSCAAPLKLNVSTADGICDECLELVNVADRHYHDYQCASGRIGELLRAGGGLRPAGGQLGTDLPDQTGTGQQGAHRTGFKREAPSPLADDSDSDWSPDGLAPRSTRSRVPKARRRWSPEPIARPSRPPPPAPAGGPRPRGRPRKYPPPPTIIEYTDIGTLKEQVKDLKTANLEIRTASPQNPLKSDLERTLHLDICPAEGSEPPAADPLLSDPAGVRGRDNPPVYECRRCEIQFQNSREMVKHLRQHVSKPWCKRCRTEFPHRAALLDHRRACRLRHRSGHCHICGREVKFYRYHMRRHADLVQDGTLEEGEPIPEDEDHPPPSVQKRVGKFIAGGVCSICGEYVPEKLRKHERSHNITHTCPICKKVFTREDVVRGHIKRVHMKERPHVCAQCGKTFVSVYSLQRHEMIHNNEYRFYCQECGDGFRQKQQLTAHMRHKHGVVDVVFEDVQVMPEGSAVVDALSVITEPDGAVYEGAVLDAARLDKGEFVITAGEGGGEEVQFTAVTDADGRLRLEA